MVESLERRRRTGNAFDVVQRFEPFLFEFLEALCERGVERKEAEPNIRGAPFNRVVVDASGGFASLEKENVALFVFESKTADAILCGHSIDMNHEFFLGRSRAVKDPLDGDSGQPIYGSELDNAWFVDGAAAGIHERRMDRGDDDTVGLGEEESEGVRVVVRIRFVEDVRCTWQGKANESKDCEKVILHLRYTGRIELGVAVIGERY